MPDTKFMPNKRLTIALGLGNVNPFANPAAPTEAEARALKNVSSGVRVNGYSFGLQPSPQNDDRSWGDDPSAQSRGFNQFGGDVPAYLPRDFKDTSDLLQQLFTLVKTPGVLLWVMTRLGPLNASLLNAGDWANVYKVMTDGFQKNVEGTGGGVGVVTFLPQGEVYPLVMIAPTAPVAITTNSVAAAKVGKPFYVSATYQGKTITPDATWSSTDTTKMISLGSGLFLPIAVGTASYSANFPGGTASTPVAVTIAA